MQFRNYGPHVRVRFSALPCSNLSLSGNETSSVFSSITEFHFANTPQRFQRANGKVGLQSRAV